MNSLIKKIIYSLFILFTILFGRFVYADNLKDAFNPGKSLGEVGKNANYSLEQAYSFGGINSIIGKIIQSALSFLGVIFVILIIYGGYLWMNAKGNEQDVEKAKNLFIAAAIGLIIVISAYAISYFVIKSLSTGVLAQPKTP